MIEDMRDAIYFTAATGFAVLAVNYFTRILF